MENRQEINRFNNLLTAIQNGNHSQIDDVITSINENENSRNADLQDQTGLYIVRNGDNERLYRTNAKQNTPFHLALQNKNNKFNTFFALMHKLENNQENSVKNLKELKRKNVNGDTVLHVIARKGYSQYREILNRLSNTDPNGQPLIVENNQPLHHNYLCDKELLEIRNNADCTAYFIATASSHAIIARILKNAENQIPPPLLNPLAPISHSIDIVGRDQSLTPDHAQKNLLRTLKKIRINAFRNAFSVWFLIAFGIALTSAILSIVSADSCCNQETNKPIYQIFKGVLFGLSLGFSLLGINRAQESFKEIREEVTTYYPPIGKNPRFLIPLAGSVVSTTLQALGLSEVFGQPTSTIFTATAPLINTMFLGRTEAVIKEETSGLKNLTHIKENDFMKDILLTP